MTSPPSTSRTGSAASPTAGTAERQRRRLRPGDGPGHRRRRLRRRRPTSTTAVAVAKDAFAELAAPRRWPSGAPGAVRVPRAAQRSARSDVAALITAEHGKVLSDAARRGDARAGGRRVRLRHPAPAQGRLLRERLDQGRRLLDPPAARRGRRSSRRSTSRPWCRCGSSRSRSRRGNTVVLKPSEKDPSRGAAAGRAVGRGGAARRACSTSSTATRRRSTALLEHPDVQSDLLRRLDADRPLRLRDRAPRTASGCRPWAARRTTWWCCPDADLDLAADAAVNAGFGSAGERCMAISALVAVEPVADELVAKIAERMATLRTGDGRRGCDMGPLVTARAPRQGAPPTSTPASTAGADAGRRRPRRRARRRRRTASGSARRCSTT